MVVTGSCCQSNKATPADSPSNMPVHRSASRSRELDRQPSTVGDTCIPLDRISVLIRFLFDRSTNRQIDTCQLVASLAFEPDQVLASSILNRVSPCRMVHQVPSGNPRGQTAPHATPRPATACGCHNAAAPFPLNMLTPAVGHSSRVIPSAQDLMRPDSVRLRSAIHLSPSTVAALISASASVVQSVPAPTWRTKASCVRATRPTAALLPKSPSAVHLEPRGCSYSSSLPWCSCSWPARPPCRCPRVSRP